MTLRTVLLCFIFSITTRSLHAQGYVWEYSLDADCNETCSRLDEFIEAVSTYKGNIQVCSKKGLFGRATKPGYKIVGEEECHVSNLRNRVFQCLCNSEDNPVEWLDHPTKNQTCQQTCKQWGKTPVFGEFSSDPVCGTIIHGREYSGHVSSDANYCIAGQYTSTITQCLCSD